MDQTTLEMFKTLTELPGAPGDEGAMRAFMRSELEKYTDHTVQDNLGSIFGVRQSKEVDAPTIMAAGHMDEVAFMVTSVTDNGMIRFQPLGGWWNQVMLAQRVDVFSKNGKIPGVIASIPPHLLTEAERSKPMEISNMLIDVGADSKDHALELGIRPGQSIIPVCPFTPMANPKKIMAKAWDNRYGCGLALDLAKAVQHQSLASHLYTGATVQEEVGLRGAQTAVNMIKPDIFFALDASPANDANGNKTEFGQLGQGTLLRILDRSMVTHRGMREFILDMAETHQIPYQYFVSQGGTDAGRVHMSLEGVPSAVIGICSRYIHTSASVMHVEDYAAAKELLVKLVEATDRSTINTILTNS
ncbi:peptidase M28 [Lysinibacillus alkalisoli]|uniref:Peptidase M28 n=1 Tax=Lysinibacillus alkalisoli TaxID=1911548 RepID=A0A917G9P9_9BACI|nr:M42 family metallopeptidase [Lysinibacillus alkalisoli]GGG30137.1 peptidase M28 [Lysinibacillus alkalisoli]